MLKPKIKSQIRLEKENRKLHVENQTLRAYNTLINSSYRNLYKDVKCELDRRYFKLARVDYLDHISALPAYKSVALDNRNKLCFFLDCLLIHTLCCTNPKELETEIRYIVHDIVKLINEHREDHFRDLPEEIGKNYDKFWTFRLPSE